MSRGAAREILRLQLRAFAVAACCLTPTFALANNGLDLIGFGAESTGMAGADIAVARDTSALNTNPAGLTQITTKALDISGAAAYALDVGHKDGFGNDVRVSNHWIPIGDVGYAQPIADGRMTVGGGMFVQGGAGNVFKHMNTAFGTNDELSAIFGAAKLSAGLGYRVDAKLSVGASLSLVHAEARQKIFPATSVFNALNPAASFFGLRLEDAVANSFSFKGGVQYVATDALTLAATYTSKTTLKLKDAKAAVNMSAVGLGVVTYRDARIDGLGFPQEIALGAALKSDRTLWSAKLEWLNWAGVISSSTLTATNPDNPLAPATLAQTQSNDWKNQFVIAVGLAHELNERTRLWAGYNYGRNPIPAQNTNPLLAAFAEQHITLGGLRKLSSAWDLAGGIELQPGKKVTYTNPALPFGANAEERNRYVAFNAMLSRRW
jgi:long-chain fatty acid transport protein